DRLRIERCHVGNRARDETQHHGTRQLDEISQPLAHARALTALQDREPILGREARRICVEIDDIDQPGHGTSAPRTEAATSHSAAKSACETGMPAPERSTNVRFSGSPGTMTESAVAGMARIAATSPCRRARNPAASTKRPMSIAMKKWLMER